jgi:hypothetical protein
MKDERGIYYHPYPQNPKARMYVRRQVDDIYFRLWNADDPQLWEEHDWVPYGAVRKATSIYRKSGDFDPSQAYDIAVARALLDEEDA